MGRYNNKHGDWEPSKIGIPSGKLTFYCGKITIFNGKIHYKWPFSIAMLVYQRVQTSELIEHGIFWQQEWGYIIITQRDMVVYCIYKSYISIHKGIILHELQRPHWYVTGMMEMILEMVLSQSGEFL